MINSVTLSGYIAMDANVRQSKMGSPICYFTLVARSGFSDKNTKEVAVPCISFGKNAEKLAGCKSGTTVAVEGFLENGMNKDDVTLQLAVKNIEVYNMVKSTPLSKRLGQSKTSKTKAKLRNKSKFKPEASTDKKAGNNNNVFKVEADDLPF